MKIELDGVYETLLIPLWARAEETMHDNPIITDEDAVYMIGNISYDFTKYSSAWMSQVGVSIRTMLLDKATKRFLDEHDDAVIINIGAGLDTRFKRMAGQYQHWYDLDVPDVIKLRKRFFSDTEHYTMIGKSVFDYSWIDNITHDGRPVLIIAEGVLMYFDEAMVSGLFYTLSKAYPASEMLFEIITPFLVGQSKRHDAVKHTKANFRWGVTSGKTVESFSDTIRFIDEWNYFDYHGSRWKWLRWPALIPAFKKRVNNSIVHVALDEPHARNTLST